MDFDRSEILDRIKEHLNFKKDSQFAEFLGIKANVLSNWKARNSYKAELIYSHCIDFLNPAYLLTGEGEMLKSESSIERSPPSSKDCDCEKLKQELEDKKELIECLKRENETLREFNATLQRKATKGNKTQSEAKKSA